MLLSILLSISAIFGFVTGQQLPAACQTALGPYLSNSNNLACASVLLGVATPLQNDLGALQLLLSFCQTNPFACLDPSVPVVADGLLALNNLAAVFDQTICPSGCYEGYIPVITACLNSTDPRIASGLEYACLKNENNQFCGPAVLYSVPTLFSLVINLTNSDSSCLESVTAPTPTCPSCVEPLRNMYNSLGCCSSALGLVGVDITSQLPAYDEYESICQFSIAAPCPSNTKSVNGGLIAGAIIGSLLGVFVLYCMVGVGVGRLVRGQSGTDAIPNITFWRRVCCCIGLGGQTKVFVKMGDPLEDDDVF